MQPLPYGVSCLLRIRRTMCRPQRNGQRMHHQSIFNPGKQEYLYPIPSLLIHFFRMASSMRKRIIRDFQSQLYKTCGIRSLVLTSYEGEDGDLKVAMYVIQFIMLTDY